MGQAAVLALVVGATVRLGTRPSWEADQARMAALAGAILIALQLAANYWAFLYLIWIVPPVAMSLLAGRQPAAATEPARSLIRAPEPELAGAL